MRRKVSIDIRCASPEMVAKLYGEDRKVWITRLERGEIYGRVTEGGHRLIEMDSVDAFIKRKRIEKRRDKSAVERLRELSHNPGQDV